MKAITFVNQLTGRFDPNAKQNIDIQAILMSIQDIIARHVREPEVKRNIAREIIALANGQSPMSTLQEPTQPSVESKAETITVIPEE
jgi:DNA replicative helicase MCM subunit Mcm2 (Cdc46/Mcm family)